MKKILFIHPNLNPLNQGGAFTRLQLFVSSLHELNFSVSILVFVPALKWPYVFYNRNKLDKNYNWILYPSFSFYTNKFLGFLNRIYCSTIVSTIVRLKKIKLIHLFDPLTSMPIINVNNSKKNEIIKKNLANSL